MVSIVSFLLRPLDWFLTTFWSAVLSIFYIDAHKLHFHFGIKFKIFNLYQTFLQKTHIITSSKNLISHATAFKQDTLNKPLYLKLTTNFNSSNNSEQQRLTHHHYHPPQSLHIRSLTRHSINLIPTPRNQVLNSITRRN